MEPQNSPAHGQIIEIRGDGEGTSRGTARLCGEAPCGLSGAEAEERSASTRKLLIAASLCVVFMGAEIIGGIKANSLAVLTDAAHLLSDVAAFAVSLFSLWAAGWDATPRQSYGFFRVEILGALVSIQLIWLLAGVLVYESVTRLASGSSEVNGFLMFLVATFGLAVNIAMALLLSHNHDHDHDHNHDHDCDPLLEDHMNKKKKRRNINIHVGTDGAYLHVLGDSIQSVGVMVGGAIIWWRPEWKAVDLVCTLVFSVLVLGTTVRTLRSILEVLLESAPREVDAAKVRAGLLELDGVAALHELHIWAITLGKVLLSCHVNIRPEADADVVLGRVVDYIKREHSITHVTIQIER